MPNSSLRSALDSLAQSFADGVLAAIRSASIEGLHAESGDRPRRGGGTIAGNPGPRKIARLARRSHEDITKAEERVAALLKKNKDGLRSEQIRDPLNLDKRELPRVLHEGVAFKKLKKRGQKRATVYSLR